MASSSTSLSVPSSSSTHRWKYDVFLSFRGEDTRQSFTSHLRAALCQKGINTFKDDQLKRGERISPALLQAIEESRFSIIIFSENYASSSWCLDELTKILECVKEGGHTALPVFHSVDPSHVRKQKGSFAEAFTKHEQVYREKIEKVVKWREALTEAANISGWDSRNRDESELIKEIVTRINLNKPINAFLSNMDALVGMDSRMKDLVSLLSIGSNDVRFIGIWGMAGIGKTTIAKAFYNQFYTNFEDYCFLDDVREVSQGHSPTYLQETLQRNLNGGLYSRRVLIVLDDVVDQQQVDTLARDQRGMFAPGSRIIVTTRDKRLLIKIDAKYEVKKLEYDEALKLFCQCAFRYKHPREHFMELCRHAIEYTGGLPLALKVLGSLLYERNITEWRSELDKLKQFPHGEIQNVLKISFDRLDDNQKNVFLDIAFFYKGEDKDFVIQLLDNYSSEIENLVEKSLITILDNKLCMHNLLQQMGWEIVRQESTEDPHKRSRLRVHMDIIGVLTNKETEAVKGIALDLSTSKELKLSVDAFAKMNKLRLLRFYNGQIDTSLEYLSEKELIAHTHDVWARRSYAWTRRNYLYSRCKLHLRGDFKFLSNELRSLQWDGYPLKSLPSDFHPEKLVELNMCFSQLKQLWEGNKAFQKLKFVKLSHSRHLTKTPDFSEAPNLERLILEGCTSLVEVHSSIGALKKLIFLNLKDCKKLTSFPSGILMPSLEILTLSGCLKLKKFPEVRGKHQLELSLEGTCIKKLPSSIKYLTGLALLNLKNCQSLESLPSTIFEVKSLKTLTLSNCTRLQKLPEIPKNMYRLEKLLLDGSAIRELPSSIGLLNGLVLLNLMNCKKLATLPRSIGELTSLRTLTLSGCSELKELPDNLGRLQCLAKLNADESGIQKVPPSINLLTNLQELSLAGCKRGESKSRNLVLSFYSSPAKPLQLPCLSGLCSLTNLNLSDCNLLEKALPSDLSSLSSLSRLDLSRNSFITIPASLSGLSLLKRLKLVHCKSLQSLPELPSSIEYLDAAGCTSLEIACSSSIDGSKRDGELKFKFSNCFRLMENEHNESVNSGDPRKKYDAIVPGSRIPEWFVDQSMGSSVSIEPPCWFDNKYLRGIAICAVVGAKGVIDPTTEKYLPTIRFTCSGWVKGHQAAPLSSSMRTDHMWFGYRSLAPLADVHGEPFPKQRMVVSFAFNVCQKFVVKKCGVRLVYDGEEKDRRCRFPFDTMWPHENDETDIKCIFRRRRHKCSLLGEGDESDSGSKDLIQSNSDSESKDLRQSCSPCNVLTNFFVLLKHICVRSKKKADLSQSNSVYSESESDSEPLPLPSSPPINEPFEGGSG